MTPSGLRQIRRGNQREQVERMAADLHVPCPGAGTLREKALLMFARGYRYETIRRKLNLSDLFAVDDLIYPKDEAHDPDA